MGLMHRNDAELPGRTNERRNTSRVRPHLSTPAELRSKEDGNDQQALVTDRRQTRQNRTSGHPPASGQETHGHAQQALVTDLAHEIPHIRTVRLGKRKS